MAPLRARMTIRVTAADVGARVTIRARHHGPEAALVDVVGVLRDWRDGLLTIERRDGTMTTVAVADLVAARVVTPAAGGGHDLAPAPEDAP